MGWVTTVRIKVPTKLWISQHDQIMNKAKAAGNDKNYLHHGPDEKFAVALTLHINFLFSRSKE